MPTQAMVREFSDPAFGKTLHPVEMFLTEVLEKKDDVPEFLDWKFWIGICLWLATWTKWLCVGYSGNFVWKCMYTAGINLAILHAIQYHGEDGLFRWMGILTLQTAGTSYLWWKKVDVLKKGYFDASSLYQDIATPLIQAIFLFFGQVCLILFYLCSIFKTVREETFTYVFWMATYFSLQMAAFFNRGADSYIGRTWNTSEWCDIIRHATEYEYRTKHFHGDSTLRPGYASLILRGLFGLLVNNVFRDILAFTVPVLLAQFTDPLNFVVYCVGVNFIVTIDDMSPKRFEITTVSSETGESYCFVQCDLHENPVAPSSTRKFNL
jgi:hypothetical protein